jgi:hypothetical protein
MSNIQRWNREPITMPGWYDRVPIEIYHSNRVTAEPSVSSSGLRTMWYKSAKHFHAGWPFNPRCVQDEEETAAYVMGRAAHHLFLGEDDFSLKFIQRPDRIAGAAWQGNRTECRDFIKLQKRAGRTVLTADNIAVIRGMAAALAEHPLAMELLQGAVEQTLIAKDPETGIWLRARPDVIPTADGIYADLKTTPSVVDTDLWRTMRNYGYHMQGALIWQVCEILGLPFDGFALVFVEKKRPFCIRVVDMTDFDLNRGRRQNRAMLRWMKRCMDSGEWPEPESDGPFSLPKSEAEFIDARLASLEAT